MIDNFEQIKELLEFNNNQTYQIIIIVRKKEQLIKENHQSARIIRYYYISSLEYLTSKEEEIKVLCEACNARAYINLNAKDITNIGIEINYISGLYLKNKNVNWKSIFETAFSELPILGNTKWVLDCDNDKNINEEELINTLTYTCKPLGNKIIAKIDTPNGYHLITNKFSKSDFKLNQNLQYKVENKENAPTLLYYPNSLNNIQNKLYGK